MHYTCSNVGIDYRIGEGRPACAADASDINYQISEHLPQIQTSHTQNKKAVTTMVLPSVLTKQQSQPQTR